jgi:uncharacterized membrane protein YeaQ/YmgE (transglycosylase-associated protein family)
MELEGLLIFLIVGAIAGWLAGLVVRGGGFGLIGDIIIGIVGAVIAGWLLPKVGVTYIVRNAIVDQILFATIGAVILLLVIRLVRRA